MIPHDLKADYPEILEYVKAHDCTFEQAVTELKLKGQRRLGEWSKC